MLITKYRIKKFFNLLTSTRLRFTKKNFEVYTIDETINKIIENNISIARYGDGEIRMMANEMNESFQTYDKKLAERLIEVAKSNNENCLVCLPYIFVKDFFGENASNFWNRHLCFYRKFYYKFFPLNKKYGNSMISRCYLDLKDKTKSKGYFNHLKKIWDKRNIILVEGEFSRLGIGNDLFENARSIKRILCPSTNAFKKYDEILEEVKKVNKNDLVLIALGHTATVLAYDLSNLGFHALDIGHIDVEYEWMRMGATTKVAIKNKYVNESKDGHINSTLEDEIYQNQIIKVIK